MLQKDVDIRLHNGKLIIQGKLNVAHKPRGTIIFAHGSGSGRLSPRNQFVAERLNRQDFTTLLMDLHTERDNRITVPVALTVRHSLIDGYHLGQMHALVQNYLGNPLQLHSNS